MAENTAPIVIVKKKGGHGGHHGGAWKVAYADFVTAMMALFIVLWLMNSSAQIRKAISAYFRDPLGTGNFSGANMAGSGEALSVTKDNMNSLKENLEQALKQSPDFEKLHDHVQMSVTGDGLRVEMIETEKGLFFQSGSPDPTSMGKDLIARLSQELGKLPNEIVIEGHTDAKPFNSKTGYSNWELSSDRANAARKLMEAAGLREGQVVQVRGFAFHNLRVKDDPNSPANRRVSVIVHYQDAAAKRAESGEGEGSEESGEKGDEKAAAKHEEPKAAEPVKPAHK